MEAACSNCGNAAIKVCVHELCDILPFMCDGKCQNDPTVDTRLYHIHND